MQAAKARLTEEIIEEIECLFNEKVEGDTRLCFL